MIQTAKDDHGEGVEIDAVRHLANIAEAVGEGSGEHLLHHRHRLVEVVGRRDLRGDLLAVLDLRGIGRRLDHRAEQGGVGVRGLGDEILRGREGAARVPVPDLFREDVDEADAVIDRALVHRVGGEEPVDVVGPQVGDHVRRRDGADLHVGIGVDPGLREVVAQQVIVHRIVEGHRELEALPALRVAPVLVLHRQGDRLAVDVLHRRHRVGDGVRSDAEGDGDGPSAPACGRRRIPCSGSCRGSPPSRQSSRPLRSAPASRRNPWVSP